MSLLPSFVCLGDISQGQEEDSFTLGCLFMGQEEFGGSKSLFGSANPLVKLRLHSSYGIEFVG